MSPLFITFEGLDGSGKSTHLENAAAWLDAAGVDAVVTQEPGGTRLGREIRAIFLDPKWGEMDGLVETLLIFASRRQHLVEVIEPALAAGRHVLCDRFTDSTLAYQGAGHGVPLEVIEQVDQLATGGRRPDKTLFFEVAADEAQRRGQSSGRAEEGAIDRLDSEGIDFYRAVREAYHQMMAGEPERFVPIDSSGSVADTERQVRQALEPLLLGSS